MARRALVAAALVVGLVAPPAEVAASSAPTVTSHPTSITRNPGESASFSAAATGDPYPTVQWERSTDGGATWQPEPGATHLNLYLPSVSTAENGHRFRAVFSSSAGSATSQSAYLTVRVPPVVSQHPEDVAVSAGASVTLLSAAAPYQSVRWWRNQGSGWVSVGSNVWYTFTATLALHGAQYRAAYTNGPHVVYTDIATVQVTAAPGFTTQPTSTLRAPGQTATFTALATGDPAPTYQWQRWDEGGAQWSDLDGKTSASLSLPSITPADDGTYRVVATNAAGATASNEVQLTVGAIPDVLHAGSVLIGLAGEQRTLSAQLVSAGYPPAQPQWQVSTDAGATWSAIPGANATSLTLALAEELHGHRYRISATNIHGTDVGGTVEVRIGATPAITQQPSPPAALTRLDGETAELSAAASGLPTPTVQWYRDPPGSAPAAPIDGATSATAAITFAAEHTGSTYFARFENRVGTAQTSAVTITLGAPPSVTTHPVSRTVSVGEPATFTAAFTGNPIPSRRWQRSTDGGTTWEDLGTGGSHSVSSPTAAMDGHRFRLQLTNVYGTTYTSEAVLTVRGDPVVVQHPADQTVAIGAAATFTSTGAGEPMPERRWETSTDGGQTWAELPGETGATRTVTGDLARHEHRFRARYDNAWGTATSTEAVLRVGAPTLEVTAVQPYYQHPDPNQSGPQFGPLQATYHATVTGSPAPEITWTRSRFHVCGTFCSFLMVENLGTGPTATFSAPLSGYPLSSWSHCVRATNSLGDVSTCFTPKLASRPVIATQPPSVVDASADGTATVSAALAPGANPAPTVTWERSTDDGATWEVVPGAEAPVLELSGLTASDDGDRYRASFANVAGTATTAETVLRVEVPGPVSKVVAAGADGAVLLTWRAPTSGTPPTGYRITPYIGKVAQPSHVVGDVTSTVIEGLANGQTYASFRVAALSAVGAGPEARSLGVTVGVSGKPTQLRAVPGDGRVTLTWVEPPANGTTILGYRITRLPTAGTPSSELVGPGSTALVTGLENGQRYRFEVATVTAHGSSSVARTPEIRVGGPSQPSNLKVVAGDGSAVLDWAAPASPTPIVGYRITPYLGADPLPPLVVGAVTSVVVPGLDNGASMRFAVAALGEHGAGPEQRSGIVVIGTPSRPTGLRAITPAPGALSFIWQEAISPAGPLLGYLVTLRTDAGDGEPIWVPAGETSVDVDGLVAGERYRATVVAVNAHGHAAPVTSAWRTV